MRQIAFTILILTLFNSASGQIVEKEFRIEKQYLNFPVEILLDRTSVEAYADHGKLFISEGLKKDKTPDGLQIKGDLKIHSLEVHEMKSIW